MLLWYSWKFATSIWVSECLQQQAFGSFRRFCLEPNLPVDLHIIIADILQGSRHVDDLYPFFIAHACQVFPHLMCMDDLRKISDLRTPASWYPDARKKARKIVFHAGPTNSGKTYNAMKRFLEAKTGVYCGPLKMLATEVFNKSNLKVSWIINAFIDLATLLKALFFHAGHTLRFGDGGRETIRKRRRHSSITCCVHRRNDLTVDTM